MRGDHSSGVFFLRLSTFKRSRVSKKKYLPDTANISWIRTKYVKHHQKENQQHNNTLSAYYLVCMMISVCALCCVHSSIPTIAMVIAQHEKAYICKRFLRKRIFRLIILDIVKEELHTRHRKRRTSLQRKTKVQRMYVNVWGKHYMRTINTYLLDGADADTTIHKH